MSENHAARTGDKSSSTSEPSILQAQSIRAESESLSTVVLRVPVPRDDGSKSRQIGLGQRIVDVTISDGDRDRGFAEISVHTYWSCLNYNTVHEWCRLTWVACFDDGACVEL